MVLVAVGAMLWGTDTLFRIPLLAHLSRVGVVSSTQLVFIETAILTVIVSPVARVRRSELRRLDLRGWASVLWIGLGAQATATVLFTLSFTYNHFVETLLLQKLQPLVAISLAAVLLGERLRPRTWIYAIGALAGAYLIVIPEPLDPRAAWEGFDIQAGLLAIAAAVLWGSATVLGRYVLREVSFSLLTFLRFATGLPALAVALLLVSGTGGFQQYRVADAGYYIGLALLPGLIAMGLYYRGLARTPASLATLAELAFPITGILVNVLIVAPGQRITGYQIAGVCVLWGALAALQRAKEPAIEPVTPLRLVEVSLETAP